MEKFQVESDLVINIDYGSFLSQIETTNEF